MLLLKFNDYLNRFLKLIILVSMSFSAVCETNKLSQSLLLFSHEISPKEIATGYQYDIAIENNALPILVLANQNGTDIRLTVKDSKGSSIRSSNLLNQIRGTESIVISSILDTSYTIHIDPIMATTYGTVNLSIWALPNSTEADRERIKAETLLSKAIVVTNSWDPTYWRPMVTKVKSAESIFEALGITDRFNSSKYINAFLTYTYLTDWETSRILAKEVEIGFLKAGQSLNRAAAISLMAMSLVEKPNDFDIARMPKRYKEAEELFNLANAIQKNEDAFADQAWTINSQAIGLYYQGKQVLAENAFAMAQKLALKSESTSYYRMAKKNSIVIRRGGNYKDSIEELTDILVSTSPDDDPTTYGLTSLDLGERFLAHGRWLDAIQAFSSSLEYLSLPTDLWSAKIGLAQAYLEGGNLERASTYSTNFDSDDKLVSESAILMRLTLVKAHISLANNSRIDAIKILESSLSHFDNTKDQAFILTALARTYLSQDDFDLAIEYSDRAVNFLTKSGEVLQYVDSLLVSAEARISSTKNSTIVDEYLSTARDTLSGSHQPLLQARLEYLAAKSALLQNDLDRALIHSERAVNLVWQQRFAVGNIEYRNGLLEKQSAIFELHADLLWITSINSPEALQSTSYFPERLLRFVDGLRVSLQRNHLSAITVAKNHPGLRHARDRISYFTHLLAGKLIVDNEQRTSLEKALEKAMLEHDLMEKSVTDVPKLYLDKSNLDVIQRNLPENTVVLSYWLRGQVPALWVISSDHIEMKQLGDAREISLISQLLHTEMSNFNGRYKTHLSKLQRLIVSFDNLKGIKHIYLIPDGDLHSLPTANFFGENISVTSIPSISSLLQPKKAIISTVKNITLFGDPVYFGEENSSLPASITEIENISALFAENEKEILRGSDATRETFLRLAPHYDIVHVAAHGVFNSEQPLLSGIAFSNTGRNGQQLPNSFFTMNDVHSLHLKKSPIVVLSACKTAFGRNPTLEGYSGFPNAFLAAGARAGFVSLWDVPDRSAAELISMFYNNLVNSKLQPADALREAQNRLRENHRWRHPVHWAGWIVVSNI